MALPCGDFRMSSIDRPHGRGGPARRPAACSRRRCRSEFSMNENQAPSTPIAWLSTTAGDDRRAIPAPNCRSARHTGIPAPTLDFSATLMCPCRRCRDYGMQAVALTQPGLGEDSIKQTDAVTSVSGTIANAATLPPHPCSPPTRQVRRSLHSVRIATADVAHQHQRQQPGFSPRCSDEMWRRVRRCWAQIAARPSEI